MTDKWRIRLRAGGYSAACGLAAALWIGLGGTWLLEHAVAQGSQPPMWLPALASGALAALASYALLARALQLWAGARSRDEARESYLLQAGAVFDSTLEGVLVTNARREVVHVNPAFCRITGYDRHEMLGRDPSMLKSGRHGASFYERVWRDLRDKDAWSGEIWNRRKSGEIYPQWQTIRVLRNAEGAPLHYVAVFSDISAMRRSQAEIQRLTHYDPLTGLPNRLLLSERLEQACARQHQRAQGCGALLLIDLSGFGRVNQSYGHDAGDRVLQQAGERLATLVGHNASLARLGDDEFALLCTELDEPMQAAALAEQVIVTLGRPFETAEHALALSSHVGIGLFVAETDTPQDVLRNASSACVQARHEHDATGYAFYRKRYTELARQRLDLSAALRQALEQDRLVLHYQPIVTLADGSLAGFEALVRWQDPARGLVPPGEFIELAEEFGLIGLIDHWVMRHACLQMRDWTEQGCRPPFVAVNVSSRLFHQQDLLAGIEQALSASGVAPQHLEIEVTESAVMAEPELALVQLARLRDRGLRLALDDFGTGHSSLLRLKLLPLHKLKIDRGFVAGLPHNDSDCAIVRAIISLGHQLGLTVLAEGVETPAQRDFLRAHGCELAQGYLFGRPQPPGTAIMQPLPQGGA